VAGMSSLGIAISGLHAAQTGLSVTGHNLANVDTVGFVRQQALQNDFFSNKIGSNGLMQLGLGTDISEIRQIRDKFLDISYREEISKTMFYDVKYSAGAEIDRMLGETEGSYKFQSVLTDLWDAMNELSIDPKGVETRGEFISTAVTFIDKANDMFDGLYNLQTNLNEQVIQTVHRINQLLYSINELNGRIGEAEASGDNANDYRDLRNNDLDELAGLMKIDYKERANGVVDVMSEGNELVVNGLVNRLGLRYTGPKSDFVEPVFTHSKEILAYDPTGQNAKALYSYNTNVSSANGNDYGKLRGLIVARGLLPANYATPEMALAAVTPPPDAATFPAETQYATEYAAFMSGLYQTYLDDLAAYNKNPQKATRPTPPEFIYSNVPPLADPALVAAYGGYTAGFPTAAEQAEQYAVHEDLYRKQQFNLNSCLIPKMQVQIDTLVHSIVTLINDTFAPSATNAPNDPNAPFGMDNSQHTEIFVRGTYKYAERYDAAGNLIPEDKSEYYSLYTIGNIKVNPILLNTSGYDKIATSRYGDESDATIVLDLLEKWKSGFIGVGDMEKLSVDGFYRQLVSLHSTETNEAKNFVEKQVELVQQVDGKRKQISGVSMDEEMKNMMIYQHAYNAAARIVNVIDSMIDKIVNGTGRVGM